MPPASLCLCRNVGGIAARLTENACFVHGVHMLGAQILDSQMKRPPRRASKMGYRRRDTGGRIRLDTGRIRLGAARLEISCGMEKYTL